MKDNSLLDLEKEKKTLNLEVFNKISNNHSPDLLKLRIKKGKNFTYQLNESHIYFIKAGYILQSCLDPNGQEKAIEILRADEIIGIETMYNDMSTLKQSVALTDVLLIGIPIEILRPYYSEFPLFIYNNLQFSLVLRKVDLIGTMLAGDQRVFMAIIEFFRYLGVKNNDTIILPPFITHKVIAMFASVSRPYVTKLIIKLTNDGLLSTRGKKLTTSNLEELIKRCIYFN